MQTNCTLLTYDKTNYFSGLVLDYINADEKLQPFYTHSVDIQGIKNAIAARQQFPQQRAVLVNALKNQYSAVQTSTAVKKNIELLLSDNTFTITTAHQPNIFTGPLYFVYKILHAIKLSATLKDQLPDYDFVPVYYMGSEDADLDELGTIKIDGVVYKWNTSQTGAVGRMKIDASFLQLIAQMHGQLGVLSYGNELVEAFQKIYTKGKTIQQATLELVDHLFAKYGLVVVIPDNPELKRLFQSVVEKELTSGFSYKAVTETIADLEKNYKVQAGGRELNLFYLIDDKRERIEKSGDIFTVVGTGFTFSEHEIIQELNNFPERFSANVILRGAFQETILPNIVFIGGGGELAYWLELKRVFGKAAIPYPMLVLRNSFLVVEEKWAQKIAALGLQPKDMFSTPFNLMKKIVAERSSNQFALHEELKKVEMLYNEINVLASTIDQSLHNHVEALKTKALNKLYELEKKMLRAEKRKFEAEQRNLDKIKAALFPGNNLQERVENVAYLYAQYGAAFIDVLLENSLSLEQQFSILEIR